MIGRPFSVALLQIAHRVIISEAHRYLRKNIYKNETHKPYARMLKEIIIIGCNVYESRQLACPAAALRTIFHPVSHASVPTLAVPAPSVAASRPQKMHPLFFYVYYGYVCVCACEIKQSEYIKADNKKERKSGFLAL